jgi:hypothetical protein
MVTILIDPSHRPARAQVLYAYFDGTIKVQITKGRDFGGDNYTEMMLRWAFATTHGNTLSKVAFLRAIPEGIKNR